MADDFLAPFFAEKIRNFTWKPWHPHRVLSHRPEALPARYARLKSLHATSTIGNADFWSNLAADFVNRLIKNRRVPIPVHSALNHLAVNLIVDNRQYIEPPDFELRSWTSEEAEYFTDLLDELETRIRHEERIREYFLMGVGSLILHLLDELALPATPSPFQVPLFSCGDPAALVTKTILAFTDELLPEADSIRGLAFHQTRQQLFLNVLSISKLSFEQYQRAPNKVVGPSDCGLEPRAMVQSYLHGTPFTELFDTPVPFSIPQAARFEHCHIIGGTGHGKTQLLQTLALADFDDPAAPGVVVIDSQGDMVRKLSRLQRFANNDRLIIIDPSDTEWPLALNIFDIHQTRLDTLSLGQREQILAGIIELYDYIFGAIGADLTQKQSVVFRYITRLMLDIPGANIQTLRELMEDEKPFRPYIDRLTGTTKAFFDNEFADRSFASTKQQIRRRLYGILSNPTFERLFSSDKNKLDMTTALNSGKVILINTAKDVLKAEASSFFGRYMIALVMQAAFERAALPESARRPAFLYIDEAADYFDSNIDTLLIQARKFKLGVTLAHQFLDQLTPALKASVMTNPAIRFAGGVSRRDANALDSDMRTTSDFLMGMHKQAAATEFACYIRNHTRSAIKLDVALGRVECEPQMSNEEYERILYRSRALVAEPLKPTPAPPENTPTRGTTSRARNQQLNEYSLRDTNLPLPQTGLASSTPPEDDPAKPGEW